MASYDFLCSLPSFDSSVLLPLPIPLSTPASSLPSILSLRLPSPSGTSLSSSPSPRCDINLRHTEISPCTNNKGGADSREGISGSNHNDDIPKRRRLSDPLGGGPALSGHSGPSPFYPSPNVMDTKDDESKCGSVDINLSSTARTLPVTFESAFPIVQMILIE